MISTTRISGTGLKKWNPAKRSGWASAAAMAVTESEEVLVASTVSGPTMGSSSANNCCLTSSRSTTASITIVQPASALQAVDHADSAFQRGLLFGRQFVLWRPVWTRWRGGCLLRLGPRRAARRTSGLRCRPEPPFVRCPGPWRRCRSRQLRGKLLAYKSIIQGGKASSYDKMFRPRNEGILTCAKSWWALFCYQLP